MNPMKIATKRRNEREQQHKKPRYHVVSNRTFAASRWCPRSLIRHLAIMVTTRGQRRIDALALGENLKPICHIQIALGRSEIGFEHDRDRAPVKIVHIPKVNFQIGLLPKSELLRSRSNK
jgi:hypothetical protein